MRALLLVISIFSLAACGDSGGTTDGGDAGRADLGGGDGGVDLGMTDAGVDMGPPPACVDPVLPPLAPMALVSGHTFENPVFVTQAPGDDTRTYVVEQNGIIQLVMGTT